MPKIKITQWKLLSNKKTCHSSSIFNTIGRALVLTCILTSPILAQTYVIDPAHSAITFRVAHMVISKVTGRFEKFMGSIDYDAKNPKSWKAEAAIDVAGINTSVPDRDKHLKSADFLDAEKYPQITFKSTKVIAVKKNTVKLHGDLTIHGVTKTVILDIVLGGIGKDPWGNERLGAAAATTINRKDFGIAWNTILESGGLLVGEEIEISIEVEGVAKKN
ncbi:MAG: polyisoprenoid-binding protein [Elusimicrobia bacterium]|nr:polyisoprenoid-binding protein [Elusimicrobiota bacterium]